MWQEDTETALVFANSRWVALSTLSDSFMRIGVNTASSNTVRLAVASESSLFTHNGANHRMSLNKALPSDTANMVFQSGYSGRAEIGLMGSDSLSVKVSNDGITWRDALQVNPATADVETNTTLTRTGETVLDTGNTENSLCFKGQLSQAEDLNAYDQTVMWHQSSNAQARSGTNYSIGFAGLLTLVSIAGSIVYQTYRTYSEPAQDGRYPFYERALRKHLAHWETFLSLSVS